MAVGLEGLLFEFIGQFVVSFVKPVSALARECGQRHAGIERIID